ncbi:MAG: hypothetical protein E7410_06365 [Ruminococcaceae bacterium]|nr:hypothetical protein [Oscillospiraceae bacterium]
MKKISLIFLAIYIISVVFSSYASVLAEDAVPTMRFDFVEVEYNGEIYDADEMSQGLVMVCGKNHKSGYVTGDGKVAIDFKFAYAGSFQNDLAPAKVAYGMFGYIDKSGKFMIEPGFDEAGEFSDSLALVKKGDKTGFIDKTGKFVDIIKDDSYTPISPFNNGVCWVQNAAEKRAILNIAGELVTDFDFVWTSDFSDGVCWASKDTGNDFKHINMGLINTLGEYVIEPGKYTDATPFCEGLCWTKKLGSDKLFLINNQGKEIAVIDGNLMPSSFSNGICVNVGGDLLSVMNTKGTTIYSSNKYAPVHYGGFSEGKMLVRRKADGKHFIMCDLNYQATATEKPTLSYDYEPMPNPDTDFEISLMVDSNTALVNGTKKMIDPANNVVCSFVSNGRTLLPMRFIAENLGGFSVTWDYISNSALVQSPDISILLAPDNQNATIIRYLSEIRFYEESVITLDQPPVNAYDRLFLPVRALSEIIGINVFYDERGLVVLSNMRGTLDYESASEIINTLAN